MTREDLIQRLKESAGSAGDLSQEYNRPQAAIEEDIEHIRTSLRNDAEYQLLIRPAMCILCGFQFTNAKAKEPTKCPECNREKIRPPSFKIEKK
jgi:predicted Zn-ribbon and HTH transcriptional regulator